MFFPDKAWKRLVGCLFLSRLSFSRPIPIHICGTNTIFFVFLFFFFFFKLFYFHAIEIYVKNYGDIIIDANSVRSIYQRLLIVTIPQILFVNFVRIFFYLASPMLRLIFQSWCYFCPCIFHSSIRRGKILQPPA